MAARLNSDMPGYIRTSSSAVAYTADVNLMKKIDLPVMENFGMDTVREFPESLGQFKACLGDLPVFEPNVSSSHPEQDISKVINNGSSGCFSGLCFCFGFLVKVGQYGFSMNNGTPEIYFPGRYLLLSPLNTYEGVYDMGSERIEVGPVSIIRVPIGKIGLAYCNSQVELLLPGVHVRNNAAFKFQCCAKLDSEIIDFGPIKIFIVRSGGVRVCYINGRVTIFNEGRYAVNASSFNFGQTIVTQQQTLRFSKHKVMLTGGIRMLVEGLLTFQVSDVEQLIHQLGDRDLKEIVERTTEAELSRIFASVHLEQISSSQLHRDESSLLGGKAIDENAEGVQRAQICEKVMAAIRPILRSWGVTVNNFQLEATMLADLNYASEYEAASLQMAKAQANLRALSTQNELLISQARAAAEAQRLTAEGEKSKQVLAAKARAEAVNVEAEARVAVAQSEKEALLIKTNAEAQARVIDSKARNDSAVAMKDPFSKKFALAVLDVDFGRSLQATHLTMMHENKKVSKN